MLPSPFMSKETEAQMGDNTSSRPLVNRRKNQGEIPDFQHSAGLFFQNELILHCSGPISHILLEEPFLLLPTIP